ncbi:predicted protein [Sclerotinia sclerotiorum 1980 UF-70]|uniref:Uncharacterized protein n=1 Tax=Sclerotinia sclerotiorum (strain ATCC 18683 / 1980 / Ss-1) TaxID=665079 RepID=A7ECK7_SCLS1|nr:predicted protein [Sclerotinia sclerotiorum 1980 UF-70]EDO00186.1 predicted protein [Sclerotinia sclerotiorum 1980 UF-70]
MSASVLYLKPKKIKHGHLDRTTPTDLLRACECSIDPKLLQGFGFCYFHLFRLMLPIDLNNAA